MKTVTLLPITEIARRGKICGETLKRRVAAAKVSPDAIIVAGRKRIPAFVAPRARAILDLCEPAPKLSNGDMLALLNQ